MSEEMKNAVESLSQSTNKLTPEQIQRLSDIAYGMSLVKEAHPEEEANT